MAFAALQKNFSKLPTPSASSLLSSLTSGISSPQSSMMFPQQQQQMQGYQAPMQQSQMPQYQMPQSQMPQSQMQMPQQENKMGKAKRFFIDTSTTGWSARFIMSTMGMFMFIFLIFGLIQLGLDDAQEWQGKMVIVAISMIFGAIGASVAPVMFQSLFPVASSV